MAFGVGGGDLVDAYPLLHERRPHRVVPAADPQLFVDVGQVALDRRGGQVQLLGYLVVLEAAGGEHDYLDLPAGEAAGALGHLLQVGAGQGHDRVATAARAQAGGLDDRHESSPAEEVLCIRASMPIAAMAFR